MAIKKIKKIILLFVFSAVFSVMISSQSGFAATISLNPTEDFTMTKILNGGHKGQYNSSNSSLLGEINNFQISFLKFNIEDLKDKVVNSAKINLTGFGLGKISLYYVDNDNWVNESPKKHLNYSEISGLLGAELVDSLEINGINQTNSFDFTDNLSDLLTDLQTKGDNYFSVALIADSGIAQYYSSENHTSQDRPVFEVGYAPVPEPSAMVLGLIGLGSMLGFRRKKA